MSQWKSEATQVVVSPESAVRSGLSGLGAGEAQALLAGCMEIIPIPIAVIEMEDEFRVMHGNAAWRAMVGSRGGSPGDLWQDPDTVVGALRRVSDGGAPAHMAEVVVVGDDQRWRGDAYPVPVSGRPRPQVLFCLRRVRVEAPAPPAPTPPPAPVSRISPQTATGGLQEELSARELEVAELVAGGMQNNAIARRLHISKATVATHVTRILQKLGYTSRAQIAAWMVERRLRERSVPSG